jgi:nitrite reductase/ring-hydroxylating ferredoxin subunit
MVTREENDRLTRVEGDAPMGQMMRRHYWLPFALSSQLGTGASPRPVRLLGENYVAFRDARDRIGFLDELCPHRRASLLLGRVEPDGLRCIYHGWKVNACGQVLEAPTQTLRSEQFAARVSVSQFPVAESGGLAWVWLGGGEAPPFPELPFAGPHESNSFWSVSRIPCNWLQGVEGTIDSSHLGFLHQTWMAQSAKVDGYANIGLAMRQPPTYETEPSAYGMRAAALRSQEGGGAYVRITEYFLPLITIVPVGTGQPNDGSMFVVSPVDDTHHLLFYGYFSDGPTRPPQELGAAASDYVPDPDDFVGLRGDRNDRWGQDRALMQAGHWTGFGRTLLEEDAAIQASMGPIVDRSLEQLSASDVAVAHARRLLLEALDAVDRGGHPPGSARSPGPVRMSNAHEMLVEAGEHWQIRVAEGWALHRD